MNINWTRIKDCLHNLAEDSGASLEYARGCIVGVASTLQAVGYDWTSVWSVLVPNLPDTLRVEALPTAWIVKESNNDWNFPLWKLVKFQDLLDEIPEEMQTMLADEYGWSCRDAMLDRYLHVMGIMQRETERESPKQLTYHFAPFRKARSQYIAEWSISDPCKPHQEEYNWHLQNTSRWLYAGCLLVQDGRVSIHT